MAVTAAAPAGPGDEPPTWPEDRARLARELHDVLAHTLSAMVVQSAAAGRMLERDRPTARAILAEVESTGQIALAELRRLAGDPLARGLAPAETLAGVEAMVADAAEARRAAVDDPARAGDLVAVLQERGRSVLGAMRDVAGHLATPGERSSRAPHPTIGDLGALVAEAGGAGVAVHVRVEGRPLRLTPTLDLAAYRIVQESIADAVDRRGASRVDVALRFRSGELAIDVRDDAPPPANDGGQLADRLALFGARISVLAEADGGTLVRTRLPLCEPEVS